MNNKNLVEFKNVTKKFGSKLAIDDISFEIKPGKIVGLLGPNGSGKTTCIKMMCGFIQANNGEIFIDGVKRNVESKKIVSYLPDRSNLIEWFTVREMINYYVDFFEDFDIVRAEEMLVNLDIDPKLKIKTLSKGTKEKVQLILVMARRAKLYVLDEPIGGVDPVARDYILSTIINNYSRESSILITTHLIHDVETILDDVIVINKGKIIREDSVENIREQENVSIEDMFKEVVK